MFELKRSNGVFVSDLLATFETVETAKEYVATTYGFWAMEDDEDNPGCVDIFTKTAEILTIEPKGFKARA